MPLERFTNGAQTLLSGAIDDTQTTIDVVSSAAFPQSEQFRILIGSELLRVTAIGSPSCTVERGVEGTTAAAHNDAVVVTHVLTAEGLIAGVLSALIGGVQRPILADFAWVNQSTATVEDHGPALTLYQATGGSGENLHLLTQSLAGSPAPATPWTVTVALRPQARSAQSTVSVGLAAREAATGKIVGLAVLSGGSHAIYGWTNPTTYGSYNPLVAATMGAMPHDIVRLAITHTGTKLRFLIGNGFAPMQLLLETTLTAFFTTAPDEIGVFINPYNFATSVGLTLLSWEVS